MELGNSGLGARRGCWLVVGGIGFWGLLPGPWILDLWVSDQRRAQRGSEV